MDKVILLPFKITADNFLCSLTVHHSHLAKDTDTGHPFIIVISEDP